MKKSHVTEIMKKKGLTLRALAEKSGITQVTILKTRNHENIFRCRLETLLQIAAALECDIHDLYTYEDDPDLN
jgi:DNA-binding Xre family transcriptional regulator